MNVLMGSKFKTVTQLFLLKIIVAKEHVLQFNAMKGNLNFYIFYKKLVIIFISSL